MKSASNYWIFLIFTSFLFNCGTQRPEPSVLPMQKAFVLLRTEGSEKEINELTNVLNSNFATNKVASDIKYYASGRSWNINQIFTTAYNNNYDYIVLIDQVAKFTIDKKTNVGGKYQIRKYHIKSTNPEWVDLGQKTCNVTVRQSIDKFSEQIIREIVSNYVPLIVSHETEDSNTKEKQTGIAEIDYNQLKSAEEMEIEISELKKELEKEKARTLKAIAEKEKLEKDHEKKIAFQKEKNENIVEGLKAQKKKSLEQGRTLEPKTRKSTYKKNNSKDSGFQVNMSNALVIFRVLDEDQKLYKGLQENLESELIFANIEALSQVINKEKAFDKERVLNWNKSKYHYLILINQIGENKNGQSVFNVSIHSEATNSTWKELDKIACNLSDGKSLKEFSKTVLMAL